MFERGREVGHPSVSLLLTGSPSDNDDALCDVHNVSMKTRWNIRLTACTKLVLWDGMRQAITRTNDMFFQRALYKLSVKFGKSFFLSKYILFFLQQYIV